MGLVFSGNVYANLQRESFAQRLDVSPERIQRIRVIAALLDARYLCLRYPKTLRHCRLSQPGGLPCFHKLEPQVAPGCFFFIDGLIFRIFPQLRAC